MLNYVLKNTTLSLLFHILHSILSIFARRGAFFDFIIRVLCLNLKLVFQDCWFDILNYFVAKAGRIVLIMVSFGYFKWNQKDRLKTIPIEVKLIIQTLMRFVKMMQKSYWIIHFLELISWLILIEQEGGTYLLFFLIFMITF